MIVFPKHLSIPIRNHKTGAPYTVVRADAVSPTEDRISEVVAMSNEPEIYEWLFSKLLEGKPYPPEKAVAWFGMIAEDWRSGSHFRFFVLDEAGSIGAACSIKSSDPDGAEIGYMSSSHHAGIMTNALIAIVDAARKARFRSLAGSVLRGNVRSRAVMERAGFLPDGNRSDDIREFFTLRL